MLDKRYCRIRIGTLYAKSIGTRQVQWFNQSLPFAPARRSCGQPKRLFAAGGCESGLLDDTLSLPYLTAAWKIKCRSAAAKIVLISLADNYNSTTGLCCPSINPLDQAWTFDLAALRQLLQDAEVREWCAAMSKLAFLPVNRKG